MLEYLQEYYVLLLVLIFLRPIIYAIQMFWRLYVYSCAPEYLDLSDKYGPWAVITGSTDGIGKAYAKELAKRNINIILISRTLEKLNKVKSEIEEINPSIKVSVIQADFSKGQNELSRIESELPDVPIGILVNNVGKMNSCLDRLDDIPEQELWDMVNINDAAIVKMTHMIIKGMKKRGKGAIVNVSSAVALMPLPFQSVYGATKIFVTYFSDAIREEYAKHGITVQCLSPFYVYTNMTEFYPDVKNHSTLCPNADKYAQSAIRTLGILDSAAGYWAHEIQTFIVLCTPVWIRTKVGFMLNRHIRSRYLKYTKKRQNN